MKISVRRALLLEFTIIILGLVVPILLYFKHGPYDFFIAAKLFFSLWLYFTW
jgi:hypothetical protein